MPGFSRAVFKFWSAIKSFKFSLVCQIVQYISFIFVIYLVNKRISLPFTFQSKLNGIVLNRHGSIKVYGPTSIYPLSEIVIFIMYDELSNENFHFITHQNVKEFLTTVKSSHHSTLTNSARKRSRSHCFHIPLCHTKIKLMERKIRIIQICHYSKVFK